MSRNRNRSSWNPTKKHVVVFREIIESEAFRDLESGARDVLFELMYRYNGENNGEIPLSVRETSERTNCSDNTAMRRQRDVVEHGFAKLAQKGAFTKKDRHASEWILTMYPLKGAPPTNEWRRWKKQNAVSKTATDGVKNSDRGARRTSSTVSKTATVVPFRKPPRSQ